MIRGLRICRPQIAQIGADKLEGTLIATKNHKKHKNENAAGASSAMQ